MKDTNTLIHSFNKHLKPDMQKRKYEAMAKNKQSFYRGSCHLFYERLSHFGSPKDHSKAWLCGDLHLENFGTFKGNNRLVYFDINDFDEALLAPISFDVLRFLTGVLISTEQLDCSQAEAQKLMGFAFKRYCETIIAAKALLIERDTAKGLMRNFFDQVRRRNREEFIAIHTTHKGKKLKLDQKHFRKLDGDRQHDLLEALNDQFEKNYLLRELNILDCAVRIAGTGSIGAERYALLTYHQSNNKHYLLDMKEARPSSVVKHTSIKQPKWTNEANRIVACQERLQFCSPALLSTLPLNQKWFVLKELQPKEDKMDFALCKGRLGRLEEVLLPMAELTAYAHLRASGRQGSSTADELAETVGSRKWQRHVFELTDTLAKQVGKDYMDFMGR